MMRNEYGIMCAIGHQKSFGRDQTRDDSPEHRHSMPHVVQHTICATRKQRLVPTRRMRGSGQQESCKWSGKVSRWHQKEKGTPTRCPSNQQTLRMTHDTPSKGSAPKFKRGLIKLASESPLSIDKGVKQDKALFKKKKLTDVHFD